MKNITIITIILAIITVINSYSQFVLKEGYLSILPKVEAEKSFKYKNLILYPILGGDKFSKSSKSSNYLPLEEALKQKKVQIIENESIGGEVNQLIIQNLSKDTVFIMAGEVVKGGKQDRVISDDMVLEPKSGKIPIEVYCVEHNRWTYKSDRNFGQYHSLSTNSVRKSAAVSKNQSEVWEKVADVTTKQNARTNTGTYTALTSSSSLNTELSAYLKFYLNAFSKIPDCVGFVGVSGDKIIGCDIFANNDLFQKQLKGLIQSYSTEAITNGSVAIPSDIKVNSYLKGYLNDEMKQEENIKKVGKQYEYKGKKMHINTY